MKCSPPGKDDRCLIYAPDAVVESHGSLDENSDDEDSCEYSCKSPPFVFVDESVFPDSAGPVDPFSRLKVTHLLSAGKTVLWVNGLSGEYAFFSDRDS